MAKAKNWIYTDLSGSAVLTMEMDGVTYKLSQFSMVFGVNEIPSAVATLAVGRDARTNEPAKILKEAQNLTSMKQVFVYFHARGDFDSEETKWPGRQIIFDGYFTGFSHKKLHGKIQVTANMIHWLVQLGFSSVLNANLHQASPSQMVQAAVLTSGTGGGTRPTMLPAHINHSTTVKNVAKDLWSAMKSFLCSVANTDKIKIGGIDGFACGGDGEKTTNVGAIDALTRIEGETDDECSLEREFSPPLPLDVGVGTKTQTLVLGSVAKSLANGSMAGYLNQTFWDVLVRNYLPSFGMAIAPLIERAAVIALTPGWRGVSKTPWKIITTGEYAATEQTAHLPKPMSGIGIMSGVGSDLATNTDTNKPADQVGACFMSDAENASDGAILYIGTPQWLAGVNSEGIWAGSMCGNKEQIPTRTATSGLSAEIPLATDPAPRTLSRSISNLMKNYAQTVFIEESLRGRTAIISGKLRFDIAPGSHIKVQGSPEAFLQGVDKLAADTYGFVQRVTTVIDAESASAMTTFNLTYLRNDAENEVERTSIAEHPLFGGNIMAGAPLRKELDLG